MRSDNNLDPTDPDLPVIPPQVMWAFCVYLESVSVLPQLRMMQKAKVGGQLSPLDIIPPLPPCLIGGRQSALLGMMQKAKVGGQSALLGMSFEAAGHLLFPLWRLAGTSERCPPTLVGRSPSPHLPSPSSSPAGRRTLHRTLRLPAGGVALLQLRTLDPAGMKIHPSTLVSKGHHLTKHPKRCICRGAL